MSAFACRLFAASFLAIALVPGAALAAEAVHELRSEPLPPPAVLHCRALPLDAANVCPSAAAGRTPLRDDLGGQHPGLGDSNLGLLMLGRELDMGTPGIKCLWSPSTDEAQTWQPGFYWDYEGATGPATYPRIAYWGKSDAPPPPATPESQPDHPARPLRPSVVDSLVLYATELPPTDWLSGAIIQLMRMQGDDHTAPGAAWKRGWDLTSVGLSDLILTDLACTDSREDWFFGCISGIASFGAVPAVPLLCNPTAPDSVQAWWWASLPNCHTTTACIDPVLHDAYAVYDRYDSDAGHDRLVFVKVDSCNFEDPDSWHAHTWWLWDYPTLRNPSITAHGGELAVVFEAESPSQPGNRDLYCMYSLTGDISAISGAWVTASGDSEVFPCARWADEHAFLCAYVRNGSLFVQLSETSGAAWSSPELMSGGDSVVAEYRTADIAESDGETVKLCWECQAGDSIAIHFGDYVLPAPAEYMVHPDGSGDFPTIQAAVDGAVSGSVIFLGDGVFTGDGNRDVDFLGKTLTVRSASGNPAACIIDCEGTPGTPHRGFYLHTNEPRESVIQGITIRNGNETLEAPPNNSGAGISLDGSSPTIINCTFENNTGTKSAALLIRDASPLVTGCSFTGNTASVSWTGGAVGCFGGSDPELVGCTFAGNSAGWGGAISIGSSLPTVVGCNFSGNTAENSGGAVTNMSGGVVDLTDCTFAENSAPFGGALSVWYRLDHEIKNCMFTGNSASQSGGALYIDDIDMLVENCTFVGNSSVWAGAARVVGPAKHDGAEDGVSGQAWRLPGSVQCPGLADTRTNDSACRGGREDPRFVHCTFSNNEATSSRSSMIYASYAATVYVDSTIVVNGLGSPVYCYDAATSVTMSCCDVHGNEGGDWVECIAGQLGTNGNIQEDPLFCGAANPAEPYTLSPESPCAPDNNPTCGQIGAWPVGCGSTFPELAAYWPFDEGNGSVAHDESGHGNDGNLFGAMWVDGYSGAALEFVGMQRVQGIPASFDDEIADALTVTVLVNWYGPLATAMPSYILDAGSGTEGFVVGIGDDGRPYMRLYHPSSGQQSVTCENPIPTDRWVHIAAVYDGILQTLKIYVNGEVGATAAAPNPYDDTSVTATIGNRRPPNATCALNGIIDELHVYGGPLAGWQIIDLLYPTSVPELPLEVAADGPFLRVSPNPFNPVTEVRFGLPTACHVKLEAYDVAGARRATLVDEPMERGEKHVLWSAEGWPSGVYFLRLTCDDCTTTSKAVLLK
ncbi:right-handed parallel beta-helix repeat-containing protein [bacterium]|nr:right-handed parallel beta-helix repeat-containing protein [bacterium]